MSATIIIIIIALNTIPFLSLLSENNTLIVMTRDFDPINEFPIHTEEFGEGIFILLYANIPTRNSFSRDLFT